MIETDSAIQNEIKSMPFSWRLIFYFKRAYSSYISFIAGLGSFAILLYELVLKNIPILQVIFPNILIFILITGPFVVVVSIFVGRWDMGRRGYYRTEAIMSFVKSPLNEQMFQKIENIEKIQANILKVLHDMEKHEVHKH
jgi:hypothetical protein